MSFFFAQADNEHVYVIPIEETVEKGLYAFLNRSIEEAEEQKADLIVFDINTPGGAVDAASEIGKIIAETEIRNVALVNPKALSAGAYIALKADEIYMTPGSTIGSAAIIDQQGNAADKKAQSFWNAAMKSAAEQNGRNPLYALAMADESIHLPKYGAEKGKLLTLTADQAVEVGYSEGVVANLDALLKKVNKENAQVTYMKESMAEKVARFVTHPVVIPILLSIGSLGLVLELYTPSFGLAGTMGISSLLLFFYGHTIAGLAGIEAVVLFVIGIILLALEFFLVGGIAGILGIGAIIASFFMASDNYVHMAISILIAVVISLGGAVVMMKFFKKKLVAFQKVILTDSMNTEAGYVSNRNRIELIGKEGVAATPLRPSGMVLIEEEYVDVVTEGSYLPKGVRVKVIKVEGSRIVVRKLEELE
ncbi:MAG TPA: nodulation protein NfeD [Bacillus sp. (in: firmicutes)]|nr:nodulation protein NfeD [Bacillus sp. (in: firmicutes)]